MDIPLRYDLLIAIILIVLINKGSSIHVEKVVVPAVVEGGTTVELQCLYREEGDDLYSLKWWKGEDQFYQYIPPKRSYYTIQGVTVNMAETLMANRLSPAGLERVILDPVGLDSTGVFRCEVMADKIFQTVHKEANMTVVYPPRGPPLITGLKDDHTTVFNGQKVSLLCTVPPGVPPPQIKWKINEKYIETEENTASTYHPTLHGEGLLKVSSSLNFMVTQELLDGSINGMSVVCEALQADSSYYQKANLILYPERSSYFYWLFSHGTCHISSVRSILFMLLISRLLA